jgi:acyl dehydratase
MASLDADVVGRWSPSLPVSVSLAGAWAYASAVGDPGLSPVYVVAPGMDLVFAVAGAAAPSLRARVVHGQEDLVFHRPLPLDGEILLRAAVIGLHGKGSGTTATIKLEQRDTSGALLNEQYVTEFYRGVPSDLAVGETAPALPREPPDGPPLHSSTVVLEEDLPQRYADASGDHNPIHLDASYARAAGLPGVIVHGLASLAIATRTVLEAAGLDASSVGRLGCRFTRPIAPGDALTTRVWAYGSDYRFDAVDSAGEVVLGSGLLTPATVS